MQYIVGSSVRIAPLLRPRFSMFRKIGTEVSARHMPKLPKYNDSQLKFSSFPVEARR